VRFWLSVQYTSKLLCRCTYAVSYIGYQLVSSVCTDIPEFEIFPSYVFPWLSPAMETNLSNMFFVGVVLTNLASSQRDFSHIPRLSNFCLLNISMRTRNWIHPCWWSHLGIHSGLEPRLTLQATGIVETRLGLCAEG